MLVVTYSFNGQDNGSFVLDSRVLRCVNADGSVAWTNRFHTRREAAACFAGDLRAMHSNSSYGFDQDVPALIASLV